MNLPDFARGQSCSVRIECVCNHNKETTVLAHIRRANVAGASQKPSNLYAVHACSQCHNFIDNRDLSKGDKQLREIMIDTGELDTYILEALGRTHQRVDGSFDVVSKR